MPKGVQVRYLLVALNGCVVELADTLVLEASAERHIGSTPIMATMKNKEDLAVGTPDWWEHQENIRYQGKWDAHIIFSAAFLVTVFILWATSCS